MLTTLHKSVLERYPNDIFVETGTHMGYGIDVALECGFKKIYSIELSTTKVLNAKERFKDSIQQGRIEIWEGDSLDIFHKLVPLLNKPTTFWLDAHWDDGPMGKVRCPLLSELAVIEQHKIKTHSILIDDRRLFDVPGSNWGEGIREVDVVDLLKKINPNYEIKFEDGFVPNDIITARLP